MNPQERLSGYDWACAFEYAGPCEDDDGCGYGTPKVVPVDGWSGSVAPFTRSDVEEILAIEEGAHDGPDWIGLFKLKDGRYAFLSAGCDYTGWDCRANGTATVGGDPAALIQFAMGEDDRARLNLQVVGGQT